MKYLKTYCVLLKNFALPKIIENTRLVERWKGVLVEHCFIRLIIWFDIGFWDSICFEICKRTELATRMWRGMPFKVRTRSCAAAIAIATRIVRSAVERGIVVYAPSHVNSAPSVRPNRGMGSKLPLLPVSGSQIPHRYSNGPSFILTRVCYCGGLPHLTPRSGVVRTVQRGGWGRWKGLSIN